MASNTLRFCNRPGTVYLSAWSPGDLEKGVLYLRIGSQSVGLWLLFDFTP